ncbi:MAG: hypothetical protein ACE5LQ_05520, partial [Candidatus Bipolaricaulia bacterium]
MRLRGKAFGVMLVLTLALMVVTVTQSVEAKSVEELLGIACGDGGPPEFVAEIRAAAAYVLSDMLTIAGMDLATLEGIATGKTPECRQAAIPALVEAYLALDPEGEGSAGALLAGVETAQSAELALARAVAAIARIEQTLLTVGLPPEEELVEAITSVLSGGEGTLLGFTVDGSNPIIRAAVGQVTAEVLFSLARVVYGEAVCQVFEDLAVNAPTHEFRATAAEVLVSAGCVSWDAEALTALVTTGGSEELRDAAVEPLSEALAAEPISDADLEALALDLTTTHQQRLAAGEALGLRWMMAVTVDPRNGNPAVDSLALIK